MRVQSTQKYSVPGIAQANQVSAAGRVRVSRLALARTQYVMYGASRGMGGIRRPGVRITQRQRWIPRRRRALSLIFELTRNFICGCVAREQGFPHWRDGRHNLVSSKRTTPVACDTSQTRSIMVFQQDQDKICQVEKNKVLGLSGPQADRTASASISRRTCAHNLRTSAEAELPRDGQLHLFRACAGAAPWSCQVNVVMGGFDLPGAGDPRSTRAPSVYWMDYMGALQKVDLLCTGIYGSFMPILIANGR